MKKIISFLFLILLTCALFADGIQKAPYSKEYLEYISTYGMTKSLINNGVIPLPYVPHNIYKETKIQLPSKYDLRDYGYIMPVRNQNPYGTCWAFSTCASMESFAMKKYGLDSISFSPLNMVNKNPVENSVGLNTGGNFYTSSAYLAQLLGPVLESDNPYKSPWTSPKTSYNAVGICEKTSLFEDGNYGLETAELNAIKTAVYENGAVQLNYKDDDTYYNSNYYSYYCPSRLKEGGHAVTIVGWDDSFSKNKFNYTPEGNGAFLIKNSWSTGWGNDGYFWISYYDKGINNCAQYEYTKKSEVKYDKLLSYNKTAVMSSANSKYGGVLFKAEENLSILGVQLFSENGGITYSFDIFKLDSPDQINNISGITPLASKTYTFDYAGHENVLLKSPISIKKGNNIWVRFNFNTNDDSEFVYSYPMEAPIDDYIPDNYVLPYCSYISRDNKTYERLPWDNNNLAAGLLTGLIKVTGVKLDKTSFTVNKGATATLSATVSPSGATDKTVTWSSDNKSVATVDSNGKVKGVKPGTANITVTTNDGNKTAVCKITVKDVIIKVTGVTLNKTELVIEKGKTDTLKETVLPSDATDPSVTWSSSDTSVATVSNGAVKGIKGGTATITVKTNDGGFTATCKVTVKDVIIKVTGVTLNKTELVIEKGKTDTLKETVLPSDATDPSVTWSTSDKSVATVNNGVVTGIKKGTATITVKTVDGGYTATCKVTVKVPVTGVELDKTSTNVSKGATVTLKATVSPSDATDKSVVWSTSDKSVATVNNGVVTGIKKGTATITVKTVDGGFTATCKVTVITPVTGVTISPESVTVEVGKTSALTATVSPSDATDPSLRWSSDTTVAKVSNGVVTGIKAGTATITVKTVDGGFTATCKVTVITPVTGVTISPESVTIGLGEDYSLKATVSPSNATDKSVTWSSDQKSVATVDSNGKVKGVKAGTAKITVKTVDGGFTATSKVKVIKIPVERVKVSPTSTELEVGKTVALTATIVPTNATDKSVTWSSDQKAVATVDANGKVTGESLGTANITVKTVDGGYTATCKVKVIAVPVTGVKLDKTSITLNKGETYTLKATVSPSNATNKSVTWSTTNKKVATVDKNGVVKGVEEGNATITVRTADGGKKATCTVTVVIPVTGVKLDKTNITLNKGETYTLKATVSPSNATNKSVTWSSDQKSVATVDSNGKVKGVKAGTAKITVKTVDGGYTATCKVTVKVPVTGVTLNKTSITIKPGATATLKATVSPSNATDKTVSWSSSYKKVATVDENGVVKGVKGGTATITVKTTDGGKKATCQVTVPNPPIKVTGVKVSPTTLSIKVGQTSSLKATVSPSNATDPSVTWSSDQKSVATVDSNGKVTGKSAGTAKITVKTNDGGYTATCKVTVINPIIKVTGVKVSPTTLSIKVGQTSSLKATVSPSNATNKSVTWSSDQKSVATVDSNGKVKGVKAGTAKITVKTVDGGFTATCTVTVVIPVTGVKLNKSSIEINKGKTYTLKATVSPSNATDKTVSWNSSDESVATVDKGVVKGIKVGTTTITVITNDGGLTAECKVEVFSSDFH